MRGNPARGSVAPGAAAPDRGPGLVPAGVDHDAHCGLSVNLGGDRDGELRYAEQEVGSAVKRVDHPAHSR